jgi:hypothetical protein
MICNVEQSLSVFWMKNIHKTCGSEYTLLGSAQNAIKNGGAGVYIEFPNKTTETIRVPTGKFCHNYDAEIQTIKVATERLLNINLGICLIVFIKTPPTYMTTSGDKCVRFFL